jgi:NADPH:quinone reductase-like Zn-dependent oxidoreductase
MWYQLESEHLPGVDVILDNIGGPYLQRNLNSLGVDGRLFIIGFQGGAVAEVNLQAVFVRHLTIQGIPVAYAQAATTFLHCSDAQDVLLRHIAG